MTQPGSPSVVLEASGMPTCCCFSSSQTFLVVAGTAEGSIHMWDLRENNAIHINRFVCLLVCLFLKFTTLLYGAHCTGMP